ncbi:hypothetical protein ACLMJK_008259 [Lecanora helva]
METTSQLAASIDGVFNFRDIGGYRSAQDPNLHIRRGRVFRCANLGNITQEGVRQLHDLGIKKIFDLRSNAEIERTADFTGPVVDIPGIERLSAPVFTESDYPLHQSVENLANFLNRRDPKFAYVDMLTAGAPALRKIFFHLRDHPSEGCLVHCTAGKDRTGVAVALILAIAGVRDADIIDEYRLTEEGIKAMLPSVIDYLRKKSGSEWTEERALKLVEIRVDAMEQMLFTVRNDYHGVGGYLESQCGFSTSDVVTISKNLLSGQA